MKSKAGVKEETKPRVVATEALTNDQTATNVTPVPEESNEQTNLLAGVKEETKPRIA